MRFRSEVHDVRDAVSRNDFSDLILVLQVAALEDVLGVVLDTAQILQMARVRQTVEVYQPTHFPRIDDVPDQIGPDKPCATRYQKIHSTPFNSPVRHGPGPPWLMARPSPDSTAWRLTS